MRITRKATLALGVGSAAVAIMTTAFAGPAAADPPSGVTPGVNDVVGVGSDTTQNVLNKLTTTYNGQSPAPTNKLYSFDAFGSATITAKTGCAAITRPAGSGAGITALKQNAHPSSDATKFCIDYARSSRGPASTDTGLGFVRFAQDAVTWSKNGTSASPSNLPASLSINELKAIYNCDASLLGGGATGPVKENQVGGTGTNAIIPVLPQSASGTRSFFLGAIGSPGTASCVQQTSLEENSGAALQSQFSTTQLKDVVSPYSVAVYLAQTNGIEASKKGNELLGSAENTSGTVIAPTTTDSTGATVINSNLGTVGLTRFVYNVVRGTTIPSYLTGIFGASGYICTNATAQTAIKNYGFRTIGSQCGTVQTA